MPDVVFTSPPHASAGLFNEEARAQIKNKKENRVVFLAGVSLTATGRKPMLIKC